MKSTSPIAYPHSSIVIMLAAAVLAASPAVAQTPEPSGRAQEPEIAPESKHQINYSFGVGFEHQLETNIDGGGEFSVSRINTGLGIATALSDDLELGLRFGYGLDWYDFSGDALGQGGAEPWEDVHTLGASAIFTLRLSNEWSAFGGPVIQFARETGASWGQSVIGGGVLGATYRVSPALTVGGGLGVVSQLEDSARPFPILIVHWGLREGLRLASQTSTSATGRTGVELIWSPAGTGEGAWEFALGAASEFSRFRLNGDGPAPRGVGENESLPVWLRASTNFTKGFRLDLIAGLALAGQLSLDDADGDHIASEDYDAAPMFGIFGHVRF